MDKKRIMILASFANSLLHFRGDFITSLIENDFEVVGAAPDMPEDVANKLKQLGATPVSFSLQRTGQNPFKDWKSVRELKEIIKANKIDLVFPYTIKPVIYGSMAANMIKVPVISLITGLGFSFSGSSRKAKIMEYITVFLYKLSIRKNKLVIFQNIDDYHLFLKKKIISKDQKYQIVDGSGVNLDRYPFRVNKKDSNKVKFILVARLIKEKGVDLFLDAASKLNKKYPDAEFHVIGAPDKSPSAIKLERLNDLQAQNIIVYHGKQDNIPDHLYRSDIFVLPSYYREGVPRSILEALSVGMPVVTTDAPGCRETVINEQNGFLIKPNDLDSLTNALEYFLQNPDRIEVMGIESRKMAETKFDVKIINNNLLNAIEAVMN